jgi:hypothetical protein
MSSINAREFYDFIQNKYPDSAKFVFEAIMEFQQLQTVIEVPMATPIVKSTKRVVTASKRPRVEDPTFLGDFYRFIVDTGLTKESTAKTYKTEIKAFLREKELLEKNPEEIKQFLQTFAEKKPGGYMVFVRYLNEQHIEQVIV